MYFRNYRLWKAWLDKVLNSPILWHPSTVNMLKVPTHLWNLAESTFKTFFCPSERNWLGKPLCHWYLNSYDTLLKHWLPMTSILFVIFRICRNYIKCNYLKKFKKIVGFSLHFWNLRQILNIFKQKDHFDSLCISEITHCERHG